MFTALLVLVIAIAGPTCPTEDASNCVWHGGLNGTGASFVDVGGEVYYL